MSESKELFTRGGNPAKPSMVDGKGIPYHRQPKLCSRCGGRGYAEQWKYTGSVCWDCNGKPHIGWEHIRLYTCEQLEKLNATRQKRRDKAAAKREAERAAKRSDYKKANAKLIKLVKPYLGRDDVVDSIMKRGLELAYISEAQENLVRTKIARMAEMDARPESLHVGEEGQRLKDVKVKVLNLYGTKVASFGGYGTETLWIVTMTDPEGNILVSKSTSFYAEKDAEFTISGTVKKHSEYKGVKQTQLQRITIKKDR